MSARDHTAPAAPDTLGRSFFLAGTMQGARTGADLTDQSYRTRLAERIREHVPDAVVHDPGEHMARWLVDHPGDVRAAHAELADMPVIRRSELRDEIIGLTELFHRLTRLAADSDVCVAWLPDHEPSMGTAAEMLSAHRAGGTVVSITGMRQNLAVLACSTLILPTLDAFSAWLREGGPASAVSG